MPRTAVCLTAIVVLVLTVSLGSSLAHATGRPDVPQSCFGPLRSQVARGHIVFVDRATGITVQGFDGEFNPGLFHGNRDLYDFLEFLGFDQPRIAHRGGCYVLIPEVVSCIDFDASDQCRPGDTDGDGFEDWLEIRLGSSPHESRSTPESELLDEQAGLGTCSDKSDNDLNSQTDRGDSKCRVTCQDFGLKDRCTDEDGDGWLKYVEEIYCSDPNDASSAPEIGDRRC